MLYQAWKLYSLGCVDLSGAWLQWSHALSSMETFPLTVARSITFLGLLVGEVGQSLMVWQAFYATFRALSLCL